MELHEPESCIWVCWGDEQCLCGKLSVITAGQTGYKQDSDKVHGLSSVTVDSKWMQPVRYTSRPLYSPPRSLGCPTMVRKEAGLVSALIWTRRRKILCIYRETITYIDMMSTVLTELSRVHSVWDSLLFCLRRQAVLWSSDYFWFFLNAVAEFKLCYKVAVSVFTKL